MSGEGVGENCRPPLAERSILVLQDAWRAACAGVPLPWLQQEHHNMSIAAFTVIFLAWSMCAAHQLLVDEEEVAKVWPSMSIACLSFSVLMVLIFLRSRPWTLEAVLVVACAGMVGLGANLVILTDNDDLPTKNRRAFFHVLMWKLVPVLLGLRSIPSCMYYSMSILMDLLVLLSIPEVEGWLIGATVIYTLLVYYYTRFYQQLLWRLQSAQDNIMAEKETLENLLHMSFDVCFWVEGDADTLHGGGDSLDEALGAKSEGTQLSKHVPTSEIARLRRAFRGSMSMDQHVRLLHTTIIKRNDGDNTFGEATVQVPVDLYIVDNRLGHDAAPPSLRPEPILGQKLTFLRCSADLPYFCAARFIDRASSLHNGSTSGSDAFNVQVHVSSEKGWPPSCTPIGLGGGSTGLMSSDLKGEGDVVDEDDEQGSRKGWDSKNCLALGIADYRKVREIGRGSQAVVWEVETPSGERAAMKVTNLGFGVAGSRVLQGRLMQARVRQVNREVRILKTLAWAESVVVAVQEFLISHDLSCFYLVMEYLPCTLYTELRQRDEAETGPPPHVQVCKWMVQLSAGVAAIHSVGAIHRDIKPANILMAAPGGSCKIGDFGVGRWKHQLQDADASMSRMRTEHSMLNVHHGNSVCTVKTEGTNLTVGIGSFEYAAPEIMQSGCYGEAVDLYALGCVAFEMLTLEQTYELFQDSEAPSAEPPVERARKASERVQRHFASMPKVRCDKQREEALGVRSLCGKLLRPLPSERPSALAVLESPSLARYRSELLQENSSLKRLFKLQL